MLSICLQAGGGSTRMGTDKALLSFDGVALIDRLIAKFEPITEHLFIISNHPERFQDRGYPVHTDVIPDIGALGGLYSALHHAHTDLVALIACDLPFANPALIQWMAERMSDPSIAAVVPTSDDHYEPTHAVYRPSLCQPLVQDAIQRGKRKLICWYPEARIETVPAPTLALLDPTGTTFINVNTPEELAQAERVQRQINE